jgi:transcriptional regulator with XRE-family HTH domain
MEDTKKIFGSRIRSLRKAKGLTQESLAERAGISVDFVSLIERGINAPSFEVLWRLANALELSLSEVFDFSKKIS